MGIYIVKTFSHFLVSIFYYIALIYILLQNCPVAQLLKTLSKKLVSETHGCYPDLLELYSTTFSQLVCNVNINKNSNIG